METGSNATNVKCVKEKTKQAYKETFQCPNCSTSFYKKQSLKSHMSKQHVTEHKRLMVIKEENTEPPGTPLVAPNGEPIEYVSEMRILGFIMSNDLKPERHLSYCIQKGRRSFFSFAQNLKDQEIGYLVIYL